MKKINIDFNNQRVFRTTYENKQFAAPSEISSPFSFSRIMYKQQIFLFEFTTCIITIKDFELYKLLENPSAIIINITVTNTDTNSLLKQILYIVSRNSVAKLLSQIPLIK